MEFIIILTVRILWGHVKIKFKNRQNSRNILTSVNRSIEFFHSYFYWNVYSGTIFSISIILSKMFNFAEDRRPSVFIIFKIAFVPFLLISIRLLTTSRTALTAQILVNSIERASLKKTGVAWKPGKIVRFYETAWIRPPVSWYLRKKTNLKWLFAL